MYALNSMSSAIKKESIKKNRFDHIWLSETFKEQVKENSSLGSIYQTNPDEDPRPEKQAND